MLRPLALLTALIASTAVNGQALTGSSQQVSLLAPQLVTFSGSQANFDAIVNGMTQGIPVTITTTDATGNVQIVTFTPTTTLAAADAARVIETARNTLITRGVATPSAQQIAVALVGGSLNTPAGTTTVAGAIPGATGTTLIQVRNEVTTVPTALTAGGTVGAANLQALRANLAQTGLSQFEVNQSLQLASVILAQNGIVTPTIDQLQIALAGGNLLLPSGQLVPIQGVLQGRIPAAAVTSSATGSTAAGFPTAGGNSVQITTPTAPTAGTPQFGNAVTPAQNAAAAGGTVSPSTAGFRATR
jgi:hypothetical protein